MGVPLIHMPLGEKKRTAIDEGERVVPKRVMRDGEDVEVFKRVKRSRAISLPVIGETIPLLKVRLGPPFPILKARPSVSISVLVKMNWTQSFWKGCRLRLP
ncbi:hypothetical protein Fot_57674 [Forsythia ovata]|uniref:Uncharacterized protein n=1 Tax=Forsythia ovata TaxID=205694 RepID=A0ABD1NUK6_9LAMI